MSASLYRVTFQHQDKVYVIHAREVASSAIWGFVEVAGLDFSAHKGVLIDPVEERLREEFADTRRLHLPMQAVLRVEEVARRGQSAIHEGPGNPQVVTPFPAPRPPSA